VKALISFVSAYDPKMSKVVKFLMPGILGGKEQGVLPLIGPYYLFITE
jgi:hypothetical protein